MADHPIIFQDAMVAAILRGDKTQTRRILRPQPNPMKGRVTGPVQIDDGRWGMLHAVWSEPDWQGNRRPLDDDRFVGFRLPEVGDRFWVRESWRCNSWATDVATIFYRASESESYTEMCEQWPVAGRDMLKVTPGKWKPSIHLPRWISRITLTITDVRVQRLHEITEEDSVAEGVVFDAENQWWHVRGVKHRDKNFPVLARPTAREMYAALWDHVHKSGAWQRNPFVVAYTFKVNRQNIDAMETAP